MLHSRARIRVKFENSLDTKRTMVVKWCNSMGKYIVVRALSSDNTKHIVYIGAGRRSVVEEVSSYRVCIICIRRTRRKTWYFYSQKARARMIIDLRQLGLMIRSLNTRKVSQVVLNCSLSGAPALINF